MTNTDHGGEHSNRFYVHTPAETAPGVPEAHLIYVGEPATSDELPDVFGEPYLTATVATYTRGNGIVLASDGRVTFIAQGDIYSETKNSIDIVAAENISMKSNGDMNLFASHQFNIISAIGDVSLNAGNHIKITAKNRVTASNRSWTATNGNSRMTTADSIGTVFEHSSQFLFNLNMNVHLDMALLGPGLYSFAEAVWIRPVKFTFTIWELAKVVREKTWKAKEVYLLGTKTETKEVDTQTHRGSTSSNGNLNQNTSVAQQNHNTMTQKSTSSTKNGQTQTINAGTYTSNSNVDAKN